MGRSCAVESSQSSFRFTVYGVPAEVSNIDSGVVIRSTIFGVARIPGELDSLGSSKALCQDCLSQGRWQCPSDLSCRSTEWRRVRSRVAAVRRRTKLPLRAVACGSFLLPRVSLEKRMSPTRGSLDLVEEKRSSLSEHRVASGRKSGSCSAPSHQPPPLRRGI